MVTLGRVRSPCVRDTRVILASSRFRTCLAQRPPYPCSLDADPAADAGVRFAMSMRNSHVLPGIGAPMKPS